MINGCGENVYYSDVIVTIYYMYTCVGMFCISCTSSMSVVLSKTQALVT